jgi:outer membrane PBP1 activator LpoA protein
MKNFIMNFIYSNTSKIRPIRWLLAASICVLLVIFIPLPAFAAVTQTQEAPGQMLYQSRQNLRDRSRKSWQVVAFKRVRPDGSAMVSLRLVGFLGAVELDHTQPLTLTTSMGQILTAKDVTDEISQSATALANVSEYDIQPVLPQLQSKISLQLTLPMLTGSAVELQIPSPAIQEWQTIADR